MATSKRRTETGAPPADAGEEPAADRDILLPLVEALPDYAVFSLDPRGRVLSWNEGARLITGHPPEEVVGRHFGCLYPEDERASGEPERTLREAAERGSTEQEGPRLRRDGSLLWANVVTTALRDSRGRLRGFLQVVRDVTARRDAEQVLGNRAEAVGRLAEERGRLVAQALAAEDRERRRISQALHDDALQTLLAVDQDLSELRADDAEVLARVREGLGRAIRQLRDTALELHPLLLERKGLAVALDAIAQAAAAMGKFRCEVRVQEDVIGAHDQFVLSIARELLMNTAKHSGAAHASVAVEAAGDSVVVEVADDGRGIPPGRLEAALAEGHIGLAMVSERLQALGGSFELDAAEGGGTVARATFPAELAGT